MTEHALGRSVAHRIRHGRIIALGDRRNPTSHTPAMVVTSQDLKDVDIESHFAPLRVEYDSKNQPPRISMYGRGPLCMPFDEDVPQWAAQMGHTLPPSMSDADSTGVRGEMGKLIAVTYQSLLHDERLVEMDEQPEIIIFSDALQLTNHSGLLPRALFALRERFPASLIWCPGLSGPDNLALLTYFGVDLHDFSRSRMAAASNLILTGDGPREASEQFGESADMVAQVAEWRREIAAVRLAVRDGSLRQLVEMRSLNSARQVEHLRHHDRQFSSDDSSAQIGTVAPLRRYVTAGVRWRSNSAANRSDPLVFDWVRGMMERYRAPTEMSSVLVLLPCSERKPYSESQSHRRFRWQLRHRHLHEVMVTSPLGLVPRELEELWPAAHYDIPVTGDWNADELRLMKQMLVRLIQNCGYSLVINHSGIPLDSSTLGVEVIDTRGDGSAGSNDALNRLKDASEAAYKRFHDGERMSEKEHLLLKMRSVSRWLHGGDEWLAKAHIAGKPPRWKIMEGKTQLAIWHPDSGRFAFSKAVLPILAETSTLPEVHLHPGPPLEGDIFPAMVSEVVGDVRVGDEVLIFREGKLVACGRSSVAKWEYFGSSGRLIKTRHRL